MIVSVIVPATDRFPPYSHNYVHIRMKRIWLKRLNMSGLLAKYHLLEKISIGGTCFLLKSKNQSLLKSLETTCEASIIE